MSDDSQANGVNPYSAPASAPASSATVTLRRSFALRLVMDSLRAVFTLAAVLVGWGVIALGMLNAQLLTVFLGILLLGVICGLETRRWRRLSAERKAASRWHEDPGFDD